MRKFKTGATRDIDDNKIEPAGYMHPLVIKRYSEYMLKHQIQSDGNKRDSNNWQKGIPKDVYMHSGWRHFLDWWLEHNKEKSRDGLEDALCGMLFNTMGYLYEVIKQKEEH